VTNQEEARGPRTMNPAMPDDVEIGYSSSRMLPLVALATMLISDSNAFDWFGDGRTHAPVGCAGLGLIGIATRLLSAANGHDRSDRPLSPLRSARRESIYPVAFDRHFRPPLLPVRAQAGWRNSSAEPRRAAAIDSAVRMSVMEQLERLVKWFHRPGSISREMLRLGYITEKSERASPFRSRIGQTACS
jgi:hypothetical protein